MRQRWRSRFIIVSFFDSHNGLAEQRRFKAAASAWLDIHVVVLSEARGSDQLYLTANNRRIITVEAESSAVKAGGIAVNCSK